MSSKEARNDTKCSTGLALRRTRRRRSRTGDSDILSGERDSRRSERQEVDVSHDQQATKPSEEGQEEEEGIVSASHQSVPVEESINSTIGDSGTASTTVESTTEADEGGEDKDKKMEPRKKRKRRPPLVPWKKPKGMPRRPLSAYNLFFKEQREQLMSAGESAASSTTAAADTEQQEADGGQKRRGSKSSKTVGIGFANLARTIASKWKTLDPESKAPYEAKANREKNRYNEEMLIWRAKQKEEKDKAAAAGAVGGMPLHDDPDNDDDGSTSKKRSPTMFPLSASHAPTSWIPPSEANEGPMSAMSPTVRRSDMVSLDMEFSPLSLKDTPEEWRDVARRPVQQSPSSGSNSSGAGRGAGANITVSMRGKDSIRRRTQKPNTGRNQVPEQDLQFFMSSQQASAKPPPVDFLQAGMLPGGGGISGLPWSNLARREDVLNFSGQQQQTFDGLQSGKPKTTTFSYPDAWFEVQPSDNVGGQANPFNDEEVLKPAARSGPLTGKLPGRKPPPPTLQGQDTAFKGPDSLFGGVHPQTGGALDAAFAAMHPVGMTSPSQQLRAEWPQGQSMQQQHQLQQQQESKVSGGGSSQSMGSTSPTSMGIRSCEEMATEFASVVSKTHSPQSQQRQVVSITRRTRDSSSSYQLVERNSLRVLGRSLDDETMDFLTRLEFSSSSGSSHE